MVIEIQNKRLIELKKGIWDYISSFNFMHESVSYFIGLLLFILKCEGVLENNTFEDGEDLIDKALERLKKKENNVHKKLIEIIELTLEDQENPIIMEIQKVLFATDGENVEVGEDGSVVVTQIEPEEL